MAEMAGAEELAGPGACFCEQPKRITPNTATLLTLSLRFMSPSHDGAKCVICGPSNCLKGVYTNESKGNNKEIFEDTLFPWSCFSRGRSGYCQPCKPAPLKDSRVRRTGRERPQHSLFGITTVLGHTSRGPARISVCPLKFWTLFAKITHKNGTSLGRRVGRLRKRVG